jgi:hypothetical protein
MSATDPNTTNSSLVNDLAKLYELHEKGMLNQEELSKAKQLLLAQGTALGASDPTGSTAPNPSVESGTVALLQKQLDEARYQADLEALEREWKEEEAKCMMRGKYGNRHRPSAGSGILTLVICVGMGSVLLSMAPSPMNLMGLLFMGLGIWVCIENCQKASLLEEAEERYRMRRLQLKEKRGV